MSQKRILQCLACLLLLAGVGQVHAQFVIDETASGAWYDPSHDGEGFLLELLDDGRAVVYWFTYDGDGDQRWFIGIGEWSGDSARFEQLRTASGAIFGEDFEIDDIVFRDAGELTLTWSDCDAALAEYEVDGVEGQQSVTRLTSVYGLECSGVRNAGLHHAGSWYDPTHDGEGLVVQPLSAQRTLVFWFSYDDSGAPAWFFGIGDRVENRITAEEMFITSGGRFGPDFDPGEVSLENWGGIEVELGCDYGPLDYASPIDGYGSGKQTMNRLTRLGQFECEDPEPQNILLVIADDLGMDASNQYVTTGDRPDTPTLDQLADDGLVFDRAWAYPVCSPTRAAILTGKYGFRTGVLEPGDELPSSEQSVQQYIEEHMPGRYAMAVIGKWHLGRSNQHPAEVGIPHYAGFNGGGLGDYFDWTLITNGESEDQQEYSTSVFADLAIDWIGEQTRPWFLWLAFNAPHTPFHLPPIELHGRDLPDNQAAIEEDPLPYYLAAIESIDHELGRVLDAMDRETRARTTIVFLGDNGTPGQATQAPFGRRESKGSLYQGGINVPFIVSGAGVQRAGEREAGLVSVTDLFSTIAAITGVNTQSNHDGLSFIDVLKPDGSVNRSEQFSEQQSENSVGWAIADSRYKLIDIAGENQQLYDLLADPFEDADLIEAGRSDTETVERLNLLAEQIRQ